VEKQLDNNQYIKWNDNTGGFLGQHVKPVMYHEAEPVVTQRMLKDLKPIIAQTIMEEDSENEEEEGEEPVSVPDVTRNIEHDILDTEVPQAFTHYTYVWTKREKMVCDLQGVLDTNAHVFELTDPAIHYKSKSGRNNVFGRSDRGKKGMHSFFITHKCNNLCKALKISSTEPFQT